MTVALCLQADNVKHSVTESVHKVQHRVQDEFDKMKSRNAEDQAWTQGRIASSTQQQPSFQGSNRKIVTDPAQDPASSGRIASNTYATQTQPSDQDTAVDQGSAVDRPIPAPQGQFHGSNRKLITESSSQDSGSSGRIPSNTSAASQLPQSADQGQGRTSKGKNWEATKARAESKVTQVEDSASRGVDKLKESVKSASGVNQHPSTCTVLS